MTHRLPEGSTPAAAPGVDTPLSPVATYHLRARSHCAILLRLVPHVSSRGADQQSRAAASAVMRHFDTAARCHRDDEEIDLFPALLESVAGSDPVCLRGLTEALTADHRALDALWRDLRPAIACVAAGVATCPTAEAVQAFVDLQEQHIRREEAELLPLAARLIDDAELERIGRSMRSRRESVSRGRSA
jgi:hemerythrin-like domain-containing protein